jgi:ribonuclease J
MPKKSKPKATTVELVTQDHETNGQDKAKIPPVAEGKLRILPLGGLGEIGKNMMVYECDDSIIIIDCGIMFPEAEMLGIDFVIPDIRYLEERKSKIKGIIFTHGHEDHVGGVPYLWPKLGCPMYATRLTAGLIEVKLEEFGIRGVQVKVVRPGEALVLGKFKIEFFRVNHSIPDGVGLAIHTPFGLVVHATDYKFDHTPVTGERTDFAALADYSRQGVKILLSESTNVEVPGYTISEQAVGETFDQIFKNAKGRIIVTSFASQINRVQQVINAAHHYRRKVAISGRSMEDNVNIAVKLGFLKMPENILQDIRRISHIPDNEVAILCTGSQGEEYSALVRMASGEHRHIKIKKGDTVVISASPIPGNEASIANTIDNLFREGALVIYGKAVDVHVSGHAAQEELKTMIDLIRPEYFIPIHGDYRFLVQHGEIAKAMGVAAEKVLVIENGQIAEFGTEGGQIIPWKAPSGYVLVDGLGIGDVGNIVLRDRQAMAKDGIFVVILTVDHNNGKILTSPDIISRGFVYMRAAEDLIYKARQEVRKMFSHHNEKFPMNWAYIKSAMRDEIGEFLFQQTQRRPMVIPVVIEV